ncbi:MAG: prepilin-type N-terminal cleavage/methylation domain-containing protein [Candidatus Eremiobacteraeota bacterium]|nr:prepilin-type N-terminal cleavage/methylation domain-containing protein [Candidatus Eremiobacteraeota bacterium]
MRLSSSSLKAFTLAELLVAMTVSSMLFLAIVSLYQAGVWEFTRSSGRIEMARRGRNLLDRVQPLLGTAIKINPTGAQEAIYFPDQVLDDFSQAGETRVLFSTPVDFLGNQPLPSARELRLHPKFYLYEVALVPGEGRAQDVVLRRRVDPLTPDPTVEPRVLGRDVDDFRVKYLRPGALEIEVVVSLDGVSDKLVRNKLQGRGVQRIRLSTIVGIPYYNQS